VDVMRVMLVYPSPYLERGLSRLKLGRRRRRRRRRGRGRGVGHAGPMEHRNLGHTGMFVSPLCLGAMMFGAWGEPDHYASTAIIHKALDAGINFVDTADVYSQGESETIVGEALRGRRDGVILATKFHGPMDVAMGQAGGDPNQRGNSRRWIVQEVENSLKRLQTDWIDLYQVHRPDTGTDDDETLAALTDLQRQGKIRAFGSSTFPAYRLVEDQWISERRGLGRFATEQPPYSLLTRGVERDVLPVAEQYHMGVIPWSPLAGGWLTGRYRKGQDAPDTHRAAMMPDLFDPSTRENQAKLDAVEDLALLAEDTGITLVHLALAFVMQHPGGDRADHRPPHHGAARHPARGRRCGAGHRRARPDRRDRGTRKERGGRRRLRHRRADRPVPAPPAHSLIGDLGRCRVEQRRYRQPTDLQFPHREDPRQPCHDHARRPRLRAARGHSLGEKTGRATPLSR